MDSLASNWVHSGTNQSDYFSNGIDYVYHWSDKLLIWEEMQLSTFYHLIAPKLALTQEFRMANVNDRVKVVKQIVALLSKPDLIMKLNNIEGGFVSLRDGNVFLYETKEIRKRVREDYITYLTNVKTIDNIDDFAVKRFFSSYVSAPEDLEILRNELRSFVISDRSSSITHVHFWGGNGKNGRQLLVYIIGSIIGKSLSSTALPTQSPSVNTVYIHELSSSNTLNNLLSSGIAKKFIVCCHATSKDNFSTPYIPSTINGGNIHTNKMFFSNSFSFDPTDGQLSATPSQTLEKWIDNNLSSITSWILSTTATSRVKFTDIHPANDEDDVIMDKDYSPPSLMTSTDTHQTVDISKRMLAIIDKGGKIDDSALLSLLSTDIQTLQTDSSN